MMQKREIFSTLSIVPPIIVRVDGRAFHNLTGTMELEKPFDISFNNAMCNVCVRFLRDSGLSPVMAYTFSDEISLFFDKTAFNGRVEKIDSVCASYAASALTLELGLTEPIAFDARVITVTPEIVCDYFSYRQKEAWRNHMNAYCQHALIADGMSSRRAAAALKGMGSAKMHDMMFARGVNLAKTPAWQRRGVLISRDKILKEGYNPIKKEKVLAERTVVNINRELPLFDKPEGAGLLRSLMEVSSGSA